MKKQILACAALSLAYVMPAQAHFPLMHCWFEADMVACAPGYSDGSKAVDLLQ